MESNNNAGSFIEEEIDLRQYWLVISRRKWGIITLAVLVTALTGLIVFSMTPYYKASSALLIEQQSKLPSIEDLYGLAGKDKQYYLTQLEVLKSRKLAEVVIDKLDMAHQPEFVPDPHAVSYNPLAWLRGWLALGSNSDHYGGIDPAAVARENLLAAFQHRLTAKLVKDTHVIKLDFQAESPILAAKAANALANAYIEDQLASRMAMTKQATGWMEKRLKVLKKNLQVSEQALQNYKEKNHLIDVKGVNTLTANEVDALTSKMVDARARYSELRKRYGSLHPKLIAARSELKAAQRELAAGKARIQIIGRKSVKLREYQRQVDSNRALYDTFLSHLKEASQSVDLHATNARIVDPAVPPVKPFKPKKGLILALAFFASLMLGVLLAFLYEALDKTIKSSEDIEEKLGLPLLGVLPLFKGGRKNGQQQVVSSLDQHGTSYAEAVRTIRTGLVLSNLDNPHKVILVTSSVPGEGKSTVSINLAMAMGKMERVLLLGADLRRPSLGRALGLDKNNRVGLIDILAETEEFNRCFHHLDDANIDILLCGKIPPNPLEMLSSDRFAALIGVLEKNYDRIIIDSPPLQAVSDSLVLARYAKAVVYVVEADQTHEKAIRGGVKQLQQQKAPLVGLVLNKVDMAKAAKYGYTYGGYYDHYGYSGKAS